MARRKHIGYKRSKRLFTKTAKRINRKNGIAPMRGGIRI